ncbi:DUF3955 domain-containing protein [Paenibacillus aquistagni]
MLLKTEPLVEPFFLVPIGYLFFFRWHHLTVVYRCANDDQKVQAASQVSI